jgi:hypothetical protein
VCDDGFELEPIPGQDQCVSSCNPDHGGMNSFFCFDRGQDEGDGFPGQDNECLEDVKPNGCACANNSQCESDTCFQGMCMDDPFLDCSDETNKPTGCACSNPNECNSGTCNQGSCTETEHGYCLHEDGVTTECTLNNCALCIGNGQICSPAAGPSCSGGDDGDPETGYCQLPNGTGTECTEVDCSECSSRGLSCAPEEGENCQLTASGFCTLPPLEDIIPTECAISSCVACAANGQGCSPVIGSNCSTQVGYCSIDGSTDTSACGDPVSCDACTAGQTCVASPGRNCDICAPCICNNGDGFSIGANRDECVSLCGTNGGVSECVTS